MTLADLALATYPVLLVVLAFLVKGWIKDFKSSVKDFQVAISTSVKELKDLIEKYSENQRICQLSLATTYRTKADAEKDWVAHKHEQSAARTAMYARLDDLTSRVVAVETRCNERHED